MNIELIANQALSILKSKYTLPDKGFIAGGSLANIMWEIVSGNKAVINDIDIFYFTNKDSDEDNISTHIKYEVELKQNDYHQLLPIFSKNVQYTIKSSVSDGIFNRIQCYSEHDVSIIIDSFDINCTRVGYSIEKEEFYWTKDFEEFLQTGEIKIANLSTPVHTAIRLVKKQDELKAKLDDLELKMCQYAIRNFIYFSDISKRRFKKKYSDSYKKYQSKLNNFFSLLRDVSLEGHLRITKCIDDKIYYLESNLAHFEGLDSNDFLYSTTFDFLFFVRNIYKTNRMDVWKKLSPFYNNLNYLKGDEISVDIDLISSLVKCHPKVINNIKGLIFDDQIRIVKTVIDKISNQYDYNTAVAVLENVKLDKSIQLDDDDCLLLGLSMRTKVNDDQVFSVYLK